MTVHDLELLLSGMDEPAGEIALNDLAAISNALQELSTGIGRHVAGMEGAGRTPLVVDHLTTLRLRGIEPGSTRLLVSVGDPDALPIDVQAEAEMADLFWEVIRGVGTGVRPSWVPPGVARSALAFRDALAEAARYVEVRRADGVHVEFAPRGVSRDIWAATGRRVASESAQAVGRLEAVDLRTRKFRIRDDVGNAVDLEDVVDADAVAPLVDQRTRAVGTSVLDPRGRLRSLQAVTVEAAPLPDAWVPGGTADWQAVLRQAPGPDPQGVEGVSSDDVRDLLSALRD